MSAVENFVEKGNFWSKKSFDNENKQIRNTKDGANNCQEYVLAPMNRFFPVDAD